MTNVPASPIDSAPIDTPSERSALRAARDHVDVDVTWSGEPIAAIVLRAGEPLYLGDGGPKGARRFVVPASVTGGETTCLVSSRRDGVFVQAPPGGAIRVEGEASSSSTVELGRDRPVRVEVGALTFTFRRVRRTRMAGALLDRSALGYAAASLAFHAIFIALFQLAPPHASAISIDDPAARERWARYEAEATEDELVTLPSQGEDDVGAADGDAGEAGTPDADSAPKKTAVRGRARGDARVLGRAEAMAEVRESGVLGVLARTVGALDAAGSPYGASEAIGPDAATLLGGLFGEVGVSRGMGGLALTGPGRGGGCEGDTCLAGMIGTGRIGTRSGIAGGPVGHLCPSGVCRGGERAARVPTVRQGPVTTVGDIDREVIRRVVRRHLPEIRHCYEQRLTSRPDLGGRVMVQFLLAANGSVSTSAVAESDLGDPAAESCIASAVRRWTFPAIPSGGIASIRYPFILQRPE